MYELGHISNLNNDFSPCQKLRKQTPEKVIFISCLNHKIVTVLREIMSDSRLLQVDTYVYDNISLSVIRCKSHIYEEKEKLFRRIS
jgi:hypothetical protein